MVDGRRLLTNSTIKQSSQVFNIQTHAVVKQIDPLEHDHFKLFLSNERGNLREVCNLYNWS